MKQLLSELCGRQDEMVRMLGEFVRCESPSHDKSCGGPLRQSGRREWKRRGANVRILAASASAEIMSARKCGSARQSPRDKSWSSATSIPCIRSARSQKCRFAYQADAPGDPELLT